MSHLACVNKPPRFEAPSLIDPPPGCPFANRCPQASDPCRSSIPDLIYLDAGHWVQCFLFHK
ncbi:MAG: hypothetical protein C3F13_14220 [Anaerolineales bacterium]|nr:hypothetical protein [Anaerolineae bacterium]PWB51587.1 MAG: hypothetical protein C3F13_14220 [Anaerolineales bacterium]